MACRSRLPRGSLWRTASWFWGQLWEAASWTSRSGTQHHLGGVDVRVPQRVGVTVLAIPELRATRRTIGPAPCRSSRCPSAVRNTGPPVRSPMARRSPGRYAALAVRSRPCRPAGDGQGPVTAFQAQVLDVRTGGLRHPQPVQDQQGDQAMLAWGSRARRLPAGRRARYGPVRQHETRNPPVAAGHARPGVIQEVFLHGVLAEPGDGGPAAW